MNIFELSFLDGIEDFLVTLIDKHVYLAPLFLLIIEEAGIPLPIPGDIIIAYTGYEVSKGAIPYYGAFILLLTSVLIGSTILYFLSARFGQYIIVRLGKFVNLEEKKLVTVEKQFKRYGPLVIIFGRHIPGFRIPITVFSGMSDISYKTFIISTFISVIFWIAFYLEVGRQLGARTINLLKAHHIYYVLLLTGFLFLALYGLYITFIRKKR